METRIYTDGGCSPSNPGPGAWAYRVVGDRAIYEVASIGDVWTTNNRMELRAATEGIRAAQNHNLPALHLVSDSRYVVNGINLWLPNWIQNSWKKANGQGVENEDLWRDLAVVLDGVAVGATWVKGHQGDPDNERVHEMVEETLRRWRKNR